MQDRIQLEFDKIEGDVRVHCDNRSRFIVTTDEKLTAFLELERVTCEASPRRSANKVDLPAPLGPTNPIRSPRLTWSETSSKSARFSATINTHPSTLNFFSQHCGKRAVSPRSIAWRNGWRAIRHRFMRGSTSSPVDGNGDYGWSAVGNKRKCLDATPFPSHLPPFVVPPDHVPDGHVDT